MLRITYSKVGGGIETFALSSPRDLRSLQKSIRDGSPDCSCDHLKIAPWWFYLLPLTAIVIAPLVLLQWSEHPEIAVLCFFAPMLLNAALFRWLMHD
jgi:hypothetical protein